MARNLLGAESPGPPARAWNAKRPILERGHRCFEDLEPINLQALSCRSSLEIWFQLNAMGAPYPSAWADRAAGQSTVPQDPIPTAVW